MLEQYKFLFDSFSSLFSRTRGPREKQTANGAMEEDETYAEINEHFVSMDTNTTSIRMEPIFSYKIVLYVLRSVDS